MNGVTRTKRVQKNKGYKALEATQRIEVILIKRLQRDRGYTAIEVTFCRARGAVTQL